MNRDDIIRMADEAGITPWERLEYIGGKRFSSTDEGLDGDLTCLIQFATLVAAHTLANIDPSSFTSYQEGYEAGRLAEREACAKVCEKDATAWGYDSNGASCAIAIRARGQA